MRLHRLVLLLLATVLAAPGLCAAHEEKPLFADEAPLHLVLSGPLPGLVRHAVNSETAIDATLAVAGSAATPIKLSARGHMRRQSGACAFPPLRITFEEGPDRDPLFRGQKKLKLVTHCQADPAFQQHLLVEMSAYRMYALLTPLSFRARLATVDYRDERGRPITSRLGFLLEEPSDVAKRNGLRTAKVGDRISASRLQPEGAGRDAVFQFMIGNLDWSMVAAPKGDDCCHNTKLAAPEGASAGLIPLPYDYDSSGLVDAPYAAPPVGVPVESVRDRRYRGYCMHNAQARLTIADLQRRKDDVLRVLDAVTQITEGERRKAKDYLNDFFVQTATTAGVDRMLGGCIR